jgi:nitrite reductase/ring-hydroxylating ferredoxin subunit
MTGPDLRKGVALADVPAGGMLLGHVDDEAVILVRPAKGDEIFAVGATCTHYSGPLAEGVLDGDTIRCPWHHACFDCRTGEAVAAPALSALPSYTVERRGSRVLVGSKREPALPTRQPSHAPDSVIIVGAGAAGNAAAEMLRREGYAGSITMIGAEPTRPVDRPNLSKDYLAGSAQEDWVFLRPDDFYASQNIDLISGVRASSIDTAARRVLLSNGSSKSYGALLLATGSEPLKLDLPGADRPHVRTLRSLAGQPSDHRGDRERRNPLRRDRRELHRPRGRGFPARARARGRRRRAGSAPARARARSRAGRVHSRPA